MASISWLKQTNPPLKPATVLRRLAVLSHVFSIARKEWGMESLLNPLELVRKPQANNARTRRLPSQDPGKDELDRQAMHGELERVVAASSSKALPAIVWLAVETAMRRGETGQGHTPSLRQTYVRTSQSHRL